MTASEQDAERLAQARQQLAVDNPFGPATRWDELTDHERKMAILDAANYLKALERAGFAVVLRAEVERLRGEVARMSAVVDTARTWRHGVLASGEECSTYALACAVDALDERSGR